MNVGADPWVGPDYSRALPRVMILGESRFDANFSDSDIVRAFLAGEGLSSGTFTKFTQAISGLHNTDCTYDSRQVWNRLIFHNYLRAFFEGEARVGVPPSVRRHPANDENLHAVFKKHEPTHMIVWGKGNYFGLDDRLTKWSAESHLPKSGHIYCHTMIEGRKIFVTYVNHPSVGFSSERWAPVLLEFLALR